MLRGLVALLLGGAIFAVPALPSSAADATATRASIDAFCASRDGLARANAPLRYARIYDAASPRYDWNVAERAVLQRIARDPNIYSELADVWSIDGTIAVVSMEVRSLDYRARATYCFRDSGTLARVDETSSGTTNTDRERRYLDERGGIVARDSALAPLFAGHGVRLSADVKPAKPDLYRTVDALPFYTLLIAAY